MDFLDDPLLKTQLLSPNNTAILTKLLTIEAHILDSTSTTTQSKRGSLKNPRLLAQSSNRTKSKYDDGTLESNETPQDMQPTKTVNFLKHTSDNPSTLTKGSSFVTNRSFHSRKNSEILSPASTRKSQAGSPVKKPTEYRRQRTKKDTKTRKDSTPSKTNESISKNQYTFPYGEDTTAKEEDSFSDPETIPLYTMIRRRSCCCSDCGDFSKFEKKHINIAIPCKRVLASREILRLSLRHSGDWSFFLNGRPSADLSPVTRRTRFSHDGSPMLLSSPMVNSPASSVSSSKRLINVGGVSWDRAPTVNLSKFADKKKKSITFHSEAERLKNLGLGKFESKECLEEDDAEKEEEPEPLPSSKILRHTSTREAILYSKFSFDNNDLALEKKPSSLAHLSVKEEKHGKSSRPGSKHAGTSSIESLEPSSLILHKGASRPPLIQVTKDQQQSEHFPQLLSPTKSVAHHRPGNSLLTVSPRSPKLVSLDRFRTDISPTIKTPRKNKKSTNKLQSMNLKIKTQSILDTYLTVPSLISSPKMTPGSQKMHKHTRSVTTVQSAVFPMGDKMLQRPFRPKYLTTVVPSTSQNLFFRGDSSSKNTEILPNLSSRGVSEDSKYRSTLLLSPNLSKRRETNPVVSATLKLDSESPKKKKKVLKLKNRKNIPLLEGLKKMYLSPRVIHSSSVKSREIMP